MHEQYCDPLPEEADSKEGLVGARITIYWDGDDAYYPCRVIEYVPESQQHVVLYEKDSSDAKYPEDLKSSKWKIWRGSDEEYEAMLATMVSLFLPFCFSLALLLSTTHSNFCFLSIF